MPQEYENYYGTDDTNWEMHAARENAQTFTPSITHTINYVVLKLSKVLSPTGNFNVGIYAVDGNHKPTGTVKCSGSITCASITAKGDYTINFGAGASLSASTEYAIVGTVPSGDGSNYILWYALTASGYGGGQNWVSLDTGATWAALNGDMLFQEWANISNYVLSCGYGVYHLTGQNATIGKVYTLLCAVGHYALIGFGALLNYMGWTFQGKDSSSYSNQSKNNSSYSNQSKNSSSWTNQSK